MMKHAETYSEACKFRRCTALTPTLPSDYKDQGLGFSV